MRFLLGLCAVLLAGAWMLPAIAEPQAALVEFTPRHALWSDGAGKRRWISLPPGTAVDKRDPDAWGFPVGTRLVKEFSHGGVRVETRVIERTAGGWKYATYAWNADGTQSRLAPEEGAVLPVAGAPGGRYEIPSRNDCVVCHEGPNVPVLGYSRVQLEADAMPPTSSDAERAARGYLHGNCGHCHNANALEGVALRFAMTSDTDLRATRAAVLRRADQILRRMRSTDPVVRMPPVGTRAVDPEGVALVERWIAELQANQETPR